MIKKILLLGAISLAFGAAMRVMTASAPAVAGGASPGDRDAEARLAASVEDARSLLPEVATLPTPGLRAAALAADGGTLAWVDDRGRVRRVDVATGKTLWRTPPLPGVNHLQVTPGGGILACSLRNPAAPVVRLLHPRWGEKHAREFSVEGAVWDLALDAEGTRAVVGTGERFVYVLPLTVRQGNSPGASSGGAATAAAARSPFDLPQPEPLRWRASGIPASVAVASGRPVVFMGLWQESGVNARLIDGTSRWHAVSGEPERDYDVRLSADGSTAVAVSTRGQRGEATRIEAWDLPSGRRLWLEDLDARDVRVRLSRDGRFIAMSYVRSSSSGAAPEDKVVLFDRDGNRLFADKGSAVFHPRLAALSPDGSRLVVQSGPDTLFVLDSRGRFLGKRRLPPHPKTGAMPQIRDVVMSDDGRYLLLRRADDHVTLLKAAS